MTDLRDMPPDPFDDGVDPFAVEAAERLARGDADPSDPGWDRLGAEPTLDDFDRARDELGSCDDPGSDECPRGPFQLLTPWVPLIGLLLVAALIATYALR